MTPTNPSFSDDSSDPIRVERQYGNTTPPSLAIVQTIAVIENVDPVESPAALGIRLHDHLDPEALDRLLADPNGRATVTLDLTLHNDHRYDVHIQNTGQLTVEKTG